MRNNPDTILAARLGFKKAERVGSCFEMLRCAAFGVVLGLLIYGGWWLVAIN